MRSKQFKNITPIRKQVLQCIADCISGQGFSPTYQEVANHLGKTRSNVFEQAGRLEDEGYIERDGSGWRNISVTEKGIQLVSV